MRAKVVEPRPLIAFAASRQAGLDFVDDRADFSPEQPFLLCRQPVLPLRAGQVHAFVKPGSRLWRAFTIVRGPRTVKDRTAAPRPQVAGGRTRQPTQLCIVLTSPMLFVKKQRGRPEA